MNKLVIAAACAVVVTGAQADGGNYALDPTHTFVTFEVTHFGTSTNRARFDKKEGMVQFDRAARTGRVEITIDMASINSGVPPFDGHLRSKDILNVSEFPTAKFVGDKFSFSGDKVTAVAGTLTMMGQTHPVTLKANQFNCYANPRAKTEACGGDFEAVIDRTRWGMNYLVDRGMPKEVRIGATIEAFRQ